MLFVDQAMQQHILKSNLYFTRLIKVTPMRVKGIRCPPWSHYARATTAFSLRRRAVGNSSSTLTGMRMEPRILSSIINFSNFNFKLRLHIAIFAIRNEILVMCKRVSGLALLFSEWFSLQVSRHELSNFNVYAI